VLWIKGYFVNQPLRLMLFTRRIQERHMKMTKSTPVTTAANMVLFTLAFMAGPLSAQTVYWRNNDPDEALNNRFRWSTSETIDTAPAAIPGASNDVVFNMLTRNDDQTPVMGSNNRAYNSMLFRSTGTTQINRAAATSTDGNTISVGSGGITLAEGSGEVTFGTAGSGAQQIVLMRAATSLNITNNSSSNLVFNRNWSSNETSGVTTLTLNGSGSGGTEFVDTVSNGSGSNVVALTVNTSGGGVTTLRGNNTYSGGTTLEAGVLALRNSSALGSGVLTINGGTLGSVIADRTISNQVNISGDFNLGIGGAGSRTTTFTGDVGLGGQERTVSLGNSATFSGALSNGGLVIDGGGNPDRVLTLSGASDYIGSTTVQSGTLLVTGTLGNTAVTVQSGGIIGGTGVLGGDLHFDAGAQFLFNPSSPLTVDGTVSFEGFSIANLFGFDVNSTIDNGIYTLIGGSVNMANVDTSAFTLADGRTAFFQEGSLQLHVIPEPGTLALVLVAFGAAFGTMRRRKL